jgi:hypothetical protein
MRDISAELREETQLLRFEVEEWLNRLRIAMKNAAGSARNQKFMGETFCLQTTLAEVENGTDAIHET